MKKRCGWCKKDLGSVPGPEDLETTGICDRCNKGMERDLAVYNGRVAFERRVLQLRKLIATDPAMIQVAMQCWLIVCAYNGGRWKALWWAFSQSLREMDLRLPWGHRSRQRIMVQRLTDLCDDQSAVERESSQLTATPRIQ